jgi:hypothetical protein
MNTYPDWGEGVAKADKDWRKLDGIFEDGECEWTVGIDRRAEAAGELPVDWRRAGAVAVGGRGIPFPVSAGTAGPVDWLAGAPAVENRARGNYGERLANVSADEAAAGEGSAAR